MTSGKPSWFEPGRLAWQSDVPFSRLLQELPQERASNLLFFVMSSAFVFAFSLCIATVVEAQPGPSLSTISGLTPPEQATAGAIQELCPKLFVMQPQAQPPAEADLTLRCTEMIVSGQNQTNVPETRGALREASPVKNPTLGASQVRAGRVQLVNVGTRLAELRGGAAGISVDGLALNINGRRLPGTTLASLLPGSEERSVTSALEPIIFPKFETAIDGNPPGAMLASLLAQSERQSTRSPAGPSPFGKLGMFVNGTFTFGDRDATSREAGFDFHTLGVTAGVDYRFTENFVLGIAFGFASTDADLDASGGSVDTKLYSGSVYGTYYLDSFYVDGIATVGRNTFESKRNIAYSLPSVDRQGMLTGMTTQVSQTATGDTDGTQYLVGFDGGYEFRSGGLTYGPYVRLNYLRVDIDGFTEGIDNTNPGFGLALEFRGQTLESLRSALGGQATYALSTQVGVFVPQVLFEWVHEFLNNERTIASNYVNDPNKTPLDIVTDKPDRDFFNLGLGLSAMFPRGMSAFLYYQTALGFANLTKHDITVGVRFAF
jgi:outer membrane autotransporter protein